MSLQKLARELDETARQTAAMVEGSAARWFAPGFLVRDPATGSALLVALQHVDDESYALAC